MSRQPVARSAPADTTTGGVPRGPTRPAGHFVVPTPTDRLHRQGGPTSTVTVSQSAGEAAAGFEAFVWGGSGRSVAPEAAADPLPPLRTALAELAGNARSGRTEHPCDARFGRDVGHVIAEAQRQIDQRHQAGSLG